MTLKCGCGYLELAGTKKTKTKQKTNKTEKNKQTNKTKTNMLIPLFC